MGENYKPVPNHVKKKVRKEVDSINKATEEYVVAVMDFLKDNPAGLRRIKKHVKKISKNMGRLEKHAKRHFGV